LLVAFVTATGQMRAAEPLDETDTPSAIVLFAKTRATVIPRDSDE